MAPKTTVANPPRITSAPAIDLSGVRWRCTSRSAAGESSPGSPLSGLTLKDGVSAGVSRASKTNVKDEQPKSTAGKPNVSAAKQKANKEADEDDDEESVY
ncbi:hypothetical protein OPV22_029221 [Ensete ventricosum]|uniref:Uncharacterized protein n=1 Tax=Ensete ventricosum TaxID=4639 RepID=A0AAV8Q611_ENSVE|nr:hypothetical protein OPV22_029221 [Ensete ventricosum]